LPKKHDPRIRAHVETLGLTTDQSASAIRMQLELTEERQRLPSERTIADWLRRVRATDASGVWRLGADQSEEPEDTAAILETLLAVITRTDGTVNRFTIAQAEWVARLRRAANLPPWAAFVYAKRYASADADAEELDLAIATWSDDAAWRAALEVREASGERLRDTYARMWRAVAKDDPGSSARMFHLQRAQKQEGRPLAEEGANDDQA